jgi:hypothetical protein
VARLRNHFAVQKNAFCVIESNVTLKYIKILSVGQQYFYGKFMTPTTMQIISTAF